MKTAAYLRISKDDLGEGLGVERQREAVTQLAKEKGWVLDPRWVVEENDTSAWDDSKTRRGFERLLRGMESGEVQAVVVYAFDRLARRLRDTARVLDLVEKHGVKIATVTGGLDLSTAYGRGIAGMLGSLAAMEVASMSERLKAKAEQNAKAGRPTNGGSRPFGYEVDRMTLREDEAVVLKEMVSWVLDGRSLTSIKNELNRRGVMTAGWRDRVDKAARELAERRETDPDAEPEPLGPPALWSTRVVRDTLRRPTLCGRVSYKGQILRGVKAQWPAILDEDTFDRVQVAIAARRRTQKKWDNRRVHLLSGLLRCKKCGAPMYAAKQSESANNGAPAYLCSRQRHLSRNEAQVNRWVIEQVKARAAETTFEIHDGMESAEDEQVREQIKILEQRRADAAREFADGSLPTDMLRMIAADLEERIAALQEKQVDRVESDLLTATHVQFVLDSFDDMDLNEQRSAIEMWVKSITVGPGKRGCVWTPEGIDIEWRDLSKIRWRGVLEH